MTASKVLNLSFEYSLNPKPNNLKTNSKENTTVKK